MRYDFIIAGTGIAGLYAALLAKEHGSVLLLTKGSIDESSTRYAQGGIAAAVGPDDSPELHLADTIQAGAGLVDEDAARLLVTQAPARIRDLARLGVTFDSGDGEVALGREGAHSRARILHAGGDATGAHVELSLSALAQRSNVTIKDHCILESVVSDGGRASGVTTFDARTRERGSIDGGVTILATGGCGQLYRVTTNPSVATGDGVAVAFRAGAEVQDMEFVQFHPTALCLAGVPVFLISEAVRGEGAILIDDAGRRFMPDYDERAELAPRDVVARAIHSEMSRTGADHVFLDVSHLASDRTVNRFPKIYRHCLNNGFDITKEPIPVSPAAHYMMGGVRTNTWGETTIDGLYACGECACTGVHGANRLASNSLLETVVFAKRVVERITGGPSQATTRSPTAINLAVRPQSEASRMKVEDVQGLMWEHAGIVRSGEGLELACTTLSGQDACTDDGMEGSELPNLVLCARLTAEAALIREESRGGHYRSDFPKPRKEWRRHIVFRRDG